VTAKAIENNVIRVKMIELSPAKEWRFFEPKVGTYGESRLARCCQLLHDLFQLALSPFIRDLVLMPP
jgi:hypothetical protein